MYELYELLFDQFVPKTMVRWAETYVTVRLLKSIIVVTLTYHAYLFLWHGFQLIEQLVITRSGPPPQPEPSISAFWQIAVVALLAANMNLRLILAA